MFFGFALSGFGDEAVVAEDGIVVFRVSAAEFPGFPGMNGPEVLMPRCGCWVGLDSD